MKAVLLYTMDGCPHCKDFKKMLNENGLDYNERNIKDHEKEYKQFVEATKNEYLPAFTLVELNEGEEPKIKMATPDESFGTLDEALELVKNFIL